MSISPIIRSFLTLLALLALVGLGGCGSTQEHRARQYSGAFGAMPEAQQQRVLRGTIAEGDSRKAVYIALGPPQAQRFVAGIEIWEYLAKKAPAATAFTSGDEDRFITPNSDEWKTTGRNPGYLAIEFEDDHLSLWDYAEEGYELSVRPNQRIVLPQSRP